MIKTIKSEYHSFICRSRMIILLAFAILVWQVVGSSLCNHAKMMEAGLQLFEPYIATANSYLVLLIVPIFALILMSDFPNLEDGYMFTIYRMGKTKWLIGKVIFALLCSFTIISSCLLLFLQSDSLSVPVQELFFVLLSFFVLQKIPYVITPAVLLLPSCVLLFLLFHKH